MQKQLLTLKLKNDSNFVRDSKSGGLNLLNFQLSNVIELETIKYAYVRCETHFGLAHGQARTKKNTKGPVAS